VLGLTLGFLRIAMAIVVVWVLWHVIIVGGPPSADYVVSARHLGLQMLFSNGIEALFWWTFAAYYWRMYRKWGRVPRVLTASAEGLVFTRLGWWRMRERRWPVSDISAVKLRPTWGNLTWKRTVAELYIQRRQGRQLDFRLSSPDPQLPNRIAQRLASVLDRPLV